MENWFIRLQQIDEQGNYIQNLYVRPSDILCVFETPEKNKISGQVRLSYSVLLRDARIAPPHLQGTANVHLMIDYNPMVYRGMKDIGSIYEFHAPDSDVDANEGEDEDRPETEKGA